jgi:hypothetical protein
VATDDRSWTILLEVVSLQQKRYPSDQPRICVDVTGWYSDCPREPEKTYPCYKAPCTRSSNAWSRPREAGAAGRARNSRGRARYAGRRRTIAGAVAARTRGDAVLGGTYTTGWESNSCAARPRLFSNPAGSRCPRTGVRLPPRTVPAATGSERSKEKSSSRTRIHLFFLVIRYSILNRGLKCLICLFA